MKKAYTAPKAKLVNYAYQEQIRAESLPVKGYIDAWDTGIVCTWGGAGCSDIYNKPSMARGLNDCIIQGTIPLD